MSQKPTTEDHDPRLPTGEWTGFYLEDHQPRRGWMHLYLDFAGGEVRGEGADYVGPWVLTGTYSPTSDEVSWTKKYVGKHQVHYQGRITANGIEGGWDIRNWNAGLFHIWPRNRFEIESLYQREDLSGNPPSMIAGSVRIPPKNSA